MFADAQEHETSPARASRRRRPAVALALLGAVAIAAVAWSGASTSKQGPVAFERELRVPPLLEPTTDAAGRKVFDLSPQQGTSELIAGKRTTTWGFNGAHLGPTLRAVRGDRVQIRVVNGLPEATTVHWHGMHLPAKSDGGPHQPIKPRQTWSPSWRVDQPAATLWYHPHPHRATAKQVYRGLAGMFIIDDQAGSRLDLPSTYGVDDIPLIVQDKRFEDDGELWFSQGKLSPVPQFGDTVLVNGIERPHVRVSSTRVRLRLLNASQTRVYNYGFSDDRRFHLIATDGGLLAVPARLKRIQLSPGERAEIVVEFEAGEDVVLHSFTPDLGRLDSSDESSAGARDAFELLELRASDTLTTSPAVPAQLVPRAARAQASMPVASSKVRLVELDGPTRIDGRRMDMGRVDHVVPVDTPEIWEVVNTSGTPHNFHVHGTQFEVLEFEGKPPPATLKGPKDTVFVRPKQTIRILTRFSAYADRTVPYMFHCHILEHEDRGMMGQFVVVKPGQQAALAHRPETRPATATTRPGAHRAHGLVRPRRGF
jgi:blue copper oxidase